MKQIKLDRYDKAILKELQENCKQTVRTLSKKVDMPIATLHRRIKRLEETKVIEGYHAKIDSEKVGKNILAYAVILPDFQHIYDNTEKLNKLKKNLANIPEVTSLYTGSADWGYLAKIEVSSFDEYNKVIEERLLTLGGIDLKDYIMVERIKEGFKILID